MVNRILLISGEYPPHQTGDAAHAYYLREQIAKRGIDVHVLTSKLDSIAHSNLHCNMDQWTWMYALRLSQVIKRVRPDGVLLLFNRRSFHDHPMMTFSASIAKHVIPGCRFVTQFETPGINIWPAPVFTRMGRRLAVKVCGRGVTFPHGTLLRDSDAIISLCKAYEDELLAESPEISAKSIIIPPPPLVAQHSICLERQRARRSELGYGHEDFVFAYFGYVYESKGIETLLAAFRVIAGRHPGAKLLIIGGPGSDPFSRAEEIAMLNYFNQLKNMAVEYGIEGRVTWTGNCSPDSAGELLSTANAFVLPFDAGIRLNNSSFSSVAFWNKAVVTTGGQRTDEQFEDNVNVLLAIPKNVESVGAAMERVICDPALRQSLQSGILELFTNWLSWEAAVDRTLSLFED